MALFLDEDEVWKCSKHPSKRRRSGICPVCLRERLLALCPECGSIRPCSCCATSCSSSSSSSSSFSRFSVHTSGVGAIGRVHNQIDTEPALRRSRSMAIPFLRSRTRFSGSDRGLDPDSTDESPALNRSRSTRSFWSMFKPQKSSRSEVQEDQDPRKVLAGESVGDASTRTATTMTRSRSVAMSDSGGRERRSSAKGRGWFFPSPMKAFRQPKASKVNQERSPLYRG
ncbi:uncharacterized protein LOC129323076 [Prosopis cineraria]|uniref:uncharacterized protein LOC129323076 n=1 Tax=Prosopis cineraria TaxID=364024 RepID=UPI0024105CC3|nr:uncharacterized protein LOC129323076 [Prosopis cineraria]